MTRLLPQYDVAVVGLGPVGAVAAQLLAREGLSVFAADPALSPYDKPRAIGLDHEALRVLQSIGIADDFASSLGAYRPSEYRSASGEVLRRIIPAPEPHPLGWPPYNTFMQPELENLLRDGFSRWPNLTVALGARCQTIEQGDELVRLTLEQSDGSAPFEVTARYAIGCDGAWSPVREAMGLPLEDLEFDEPWLVIDMLVNEQARLPDVTIQYCDPARPSTFVPGPKTLRRWEIMLLPGEDPVEMAKEDSVWALLSRWMTPEQGRIWRTATYRFHALVAGSWQRGRVFIAGDAAHQTPPFMAQGLNQGFRDAANLCWKIGEVVKHGADPAMLDSYDEERRPNAKAVIELTKAFGRLICERDPAAAAERDARMLDEMRSGRGEMVRQDLLPPICGGFLFHTADGALSPAAGTIFPQPWISTDTGLRRMDDGFDARFLMVFDGPPEIDPAVQAQARGLGVTLAVVGDRFPAEGMAVIEEKDPLVSDWMKRHGARVALVRPDHVVFGTGGSHADARTLLDGLGQLRGE